MHVTQRWVQKGLPGMIQACHAIVTPAPPHRSASPPPFAPQPRRWHVAAIGLLTILCDEQAATTAAFHVPPLRIDAAHRRRLTRW